MSKRTKDEAAKNEDADIKAIVQGLHGKDKKMAPIFNEFKKKFGLEILDARHRKGSSRGTHYDFEILVEFQNQESTAEKGQGQAQAQEQGWRTVEHKGSQQYKPIGPKETPWAAGVQFHNGGCEKYSLAKKYAQTHYDIHIKSGALKQEFDIKAEIPTYEEWFKDCATQSDPKTAFGKELKRKVREQRGPKTSLLEKRQPVLDNLNITEADKQLLIKEVLPIANNALEQKDYWLTIHGDINGEFHAAWFPKFTIKAINEVIVEKNKDIEFIFKCENDFSFKGILRWGKGAGFSCLRIDLR